MRLLTGFRGPPKYRVILIPNWTYYPQTRQRRNEVQIFELALTSDLGLYMCKLISDLESWLKRVHTHTRARSRTRAHTHTHTHTHPHTYWTLLERTRDLSCVSYDERKKVLVMTKERKRDMII